MSVFSTIKKRYLSATPKQLMLTGVFAMAFAAAIGGGFASKQTSSAATGRDCTVNSIDFKNMNGGCGAQTPHEFADDIRDGNPSDLNEIYSSFGLTPSKHDRFESTAREGIAYQDGRVVVDGQTVMTDAWSIGRTKFSYAKNYWINNKLFYWSWHTQVLKQNLPVMVMFDENGTVEFSVIKACGNPMGGVVVKSGAECKSLNMTPAGQKNTYNFTTSTTKFGLAKIVKYDYYYNDGNGDKLFASKSNGSDVVTKFFDKSATVKVKVTISLPGGKTKVITSTLCEKHVGVVKEEFLYVCDALIATARDNTNRKFRFTVNTKQSNNVTVDSADFTLDGNFTTSGVTAKDSDGNFYKDYDFSDDKTHKVSVIVNFTADGKHVTSKEGACVARVTPEKTPECKPGIPVGSPKCEDLPSTGPAGIAGLFTGVSLVGAAAHRLYMSRKNRG
jgi:hypothetical protein